MTGKVVPLRPRTDSVKDIVTGETWNHIVDFIEPQISEVEICLHQSASKAPKIIRDHLLDLLKGGDRFCPALFLTILKDREADKAKMVQFASSLEALDLAIRVHRSIDRYGQNKPHSYTTAILAGDFYFSLALTLAGDAPVFIKGMAEIIARVVSSAIETLDPGGNITCWRQAYLRKISDGYASIMALSATLAGWCSDMEAWQNESLAFFGHYVGMGLQLRREQAGLKINQGETVFFNQITLPFIYILEHSARQRELLSLLKRPEGLNLNDDLFVGEYKNTNPDKYIDQISGNCISKARECLEVLQGSLTTDTEAVLNGFARVHQLV
jgi:geranylgeranyl pyrophosphate synthase